MTPHVVRRETEYERPWLAVEAKEVRFDASHDATYYYVRTHDYAAILAVTEDGRIPLVRQFRPAVERRSLELPSGLVEGDEVPLETVRRELLEETGCLADQIVPIATFDVDTGRMQTTEHAFFASGVRVVRAGASAEEPDLEVIFVTPAELLQLVATGEFRMAAHVAVVGAISMRGLLE